MMCCQESKLYLEASNWLLPGTQRGDKSREAGSPLRASDSQMCLSSVLQPAGAERESKAHDLSKVPSRSGFLPLKAGPQSAAPP